MNVRRNLVKLVGIGAVVVALAAGGAGVADAGTVAPRSAAGAGAVQVRPHTGGFANLTIGSLGGGWYAVTISGHADLTSVVAQNISFSLYGDDTFFDTNLFDKNGLTTDGYGNFWVTLTLPGYTLDEDWGRDEVYAKAHVYDPYYGTFNITTNTVTGYF